MTSHNNKIPLISLIIPCYNAARFLDSCLKSLVDQEYFKECEIILVDDASTDGNKTKNKCFEGTKKHNNIKFIQLKNNGGQAIARNNGIKHASGKYIGFIDADDTVKHNYFDEITKAISNYNPDIIVWGNTEMYFENNERLMRSINIVPKKGIFEADAIIKQCIELEEQTLFGYIGNKIYSRKIINTFDVQFQNKYYIEDYLFNLDVFNNAKKVYCIDKPLYNYIKRINETSSATSLYNLNYFDEHYTRIESFMNGLKKNNLLDDSAKTKLANRYLRYSLSAIGRNKDSRSGMSKEEQKSWLKNYYSLELTKQLLEYANANEGKAKISTFLFKKKYYHLLLLEAKIINNVSKNNAKQMSKLKQKR